MSRALNRLRAIRERARDGSVKPAAFRVWSVLESYSNEYGENAFPGVDTIAALIGSDKKTVQRALGELAAAKWITISKRAGGKGYPHNVYTVHF